ncbi:hypothetical protein [Taibaiella helva]|uniref:hypothetical protein n=1 Tax=Taibaiella helva TaxID=2301235 RepID=UPI000E58C387|nr:hypothetical protein [Taibaiella helva]
MDPYTHIKVILGILLGLSIRHLLNGAVKLVQHPGRNQAYWIHLSWTIYLFLLLIHFWWWEFHLVEIKHWLFTDYFLVILYIIVYYVLCALLYPDDLKDYSGFRQYFYSRRQWFFGLLGASYVLDTVDTLIKGRAYFLHFGPEYPLRNVLHFILCIVAMKVSSPRFHAVLVSLFILYEVSYILRLFLAE